MIKRTVFSGLALAAVGGFLFSSCTNSTSPGTTVGAPSNLMALSKDASTISIEWTRASGDTAADTIILSSSAGASASPTGGTDTKADLTGLSNGIVYTITVASSGGRSSSINWMTAVRTSNIQVFEFSSSGMSGLQLNGPGGAARAISLNLTTEPNAASEVDFLLDDATHDNTITAASGLSFEGTQVFDITWRHSYIRDDQNYIPGGLDNFYSATDFSAFLNAASSAHNSYDIPADAVYGTKGDRVLTVATQDGNLAKIDIIPDPTTGQLYSGSGTDRYITVDVSYQPIAGKPYASRPHSYPAGREARNSVK